MNHRLRIYVQIACAMLAVAALSFWLDSNWHDSYARLFMFNHSLQITSAGGRVILTSIDAPVGPDCTCAGRSTSDRMVRWESYTGAVSRLPGPARVGLLTKNFSAAGPVALTQGLAYQRTGEIPVTVTTRPATATAPTRPRNQAEQQFAHLIGAITNSLRPKLTRPSNLPRYDSLQMTFGPRKRIDDVTVLGVNGVGDSYHNLIVPHWLIALIAAMLPLRWAITRGLRRIRSARRQRHGLCRDCGYDLRGNPGAACPECGAASPASA